MARKHDDRTISKEAYERKYHETLAELHRVRAQLAQSDGEGDTWLDELEAVSDRSVGYWRIGRSGNGHYWVRWKWTHGPQAGRYAIGGHDSLRLAVACCLADISLIESGKKQAPLDVGYRKY